MATMRSSLVHPRYKTEYRVRNWREYERGLRARGDVTVWFSEDAIANWISRSTGARGGPRLYSDLAIETALTLRTVFALPPIFRCRITARCRDERSRSTFQCK